MNERRQVRRQRSLLVGRIAFNNSCSTMDCLVRDISDRGARVSFPDSVRPPSAFDLSIEHKGLNARAEVIWRLADQFGVSFLETDSQLVAAPPDVERRLSRYRAENARLKQRVRELSS